MMNPNTSITIGWLIFFIAVLAAVLLYVAFTGVSEDFKDIDEEEEGENK